MRLTYFWAAGQIHCVPLSYYKSQRDHWCPTSCIPRVWDQACKGNNPRTDFRHQQGSISACVKLAREEQRAFSFRLPLHILSTVCCSRLHAKASAAYTWSPEFWTALFFICHCTVNVYLKQQDGKDHRLMLFKFQGDPIYLDPWEIDVHVGWEWAWDEADSCYEIVCRCSSHISRFRSG